MTFLYLEVSVYFRFLLAFIISISSLVLAPLLLSKDQEAHRLHRRRDVNSCLQTNTNKCGTLLIKVI